MDIKFYYNYTSFPQELKPLIDLHPIIPTRRSEKSWWKNMPSSHEIENFQKQGWPEPEQAPTMKYCPGIYDFINCGYTVPAWQEFEFLAREAKTILFLEESINTRKKKTHVKFFN